MTIAHRPDATADLRDALSRRILVLDGVHDLRQYLASMLIASDADVKVVQARLRHASAKTTPDTYAHLWHDSDESTRTAIDAVMQSPCQGAARLSRRVTSGRRPTAGRDAAGLWGSA